MRLPIPQAQLLVPLTTLLSLSAAAQSFPPFSPSSDKLFANTDHSRTYSVAFDSTVVVGDTTSYFNFSTVRDTMVPSACPWWGGPQCMPMDQPTWLGQRVDAVPNGTHVFHTLFGQDLTFEFNTVPGSETVIYSDPDQQFILHHEGSGNYTVLGQIESVQQWSVLHLDEFGAVINSPLNNALVEIGGTMGLLRFFRVDSFPLVLEPVELVGLTEPEAGFYEITEATLEDHQPGDEVQFHEYYDLVFGPPWADYNRYRKYIYLTRDDQPDVVNYTVRQELFDAGSTDLAIDTIMLSYSRTNVIASIPFERFDGTWPRLYEADYCGTPRWTYVHELNTGAAYCEEENCWGPYDTNGPPPQGANTYTVGVGLFDRTESIFSPSGYSLHHEIIFFKKDSVDCFQEIILGEEPQALAAQPILFPNPSDGLFTISGTAVQAVEVVDARGNRVMLPTSATLRGSLDLRALAPGIYLVRLTRSDGRVATERVLIQR